MDFLSSYSSPHVKSGSFASKIGVTKLLAVVTIIFHLAQAIFNSAANLYAVWFLNTVDKRLRNFFARWTHSIW